MVTSKIDLKSRYTYKTRQADYINFQYSYKGYFKWNCRKYIIRIPITVHVPVAQTKRGKPK